MGHSIETSTLTSQLKSDLHTYDLVILFGSFARGEESTESDIDILLVDSQFSGWTVFEECEVPEEIQLEWPDKYPSIHIITSSHRTFHRKYCDNLEFMENLENEGVGLIPQFGLVDYMTEIRRGQFKS